MSILNKKPTELDSFSQREHHTITQTHSLCIALQQLHDQQLSHQHLSPLSVNVKPDYTVELIHHFPPIPFDSCHEISFQAVPKAFHPDFLSPEQKAQNKRSIDYSSDYFSVGILMVYWLTGSTPLRSIDGSILLNLPTHINSNLLSIIQKLLSVYPEDRYLSVTGILNDIQSSFKSSLVFFPGKSDKAETLIFSDLLFGRDHACNELLTQFQSITRGCKKCVLVSGEAGVGKTSLISNTFNTLCKHKGVYCYGKVDFITDTPYSAIVNAFTELITYHINSDTIAAWKPILITTLKSNLSLIGNFIPSLGQFLGTTFNEDDSDPLRLKNRLFYSCSQLLSLLCTAETPVVLYIDDLQWMNQDEMELLNYILKSNISHFLLIGAYRSSECKENHPLSLTIKQEDYIAIDLDNLHFEDTKEWIANLFKSGECTMLAKILHNKTHGNPYFTRKLIEYLYKTKSISFNRETRSWKWDLKEIQQVNLADNIVHLILETFYDLPLSLQTFLQQASCLGSYFKTSTLSAAFQYSEFQIKHLINMSLEYNFISETMTQDLYKFTHDRILRNIYFEISEKTRHTLHWLIANSELSLFSSNHHTISLIEACQHLVKGQLAIPEIDRLRIVDHLLMGGQKAKNSSDFKSALNFYTTAKNIYLKVESFFNEDKSQTIHLLECDTAFLAKENQLHVQLLKKLKSKPLSHKSLLEVTIQELRYFDYIGNYSEASNVGALILESLKINLTGPLFFIKAVISLITLLLAPKRFTDTNKPLLPENEKVKLVLMSRLTTIFYRTNHKKMSALIFKQLEFTKSFAPNNTTPLCLLILSIYITHTLKLRKMGIRLAKEAFILEKKFDQSPYTCQFFQIYATFVQCWLKPIHNMPKNLKKAIQIGLTSGDQVYTEIAYNNLVNAEFQKGTSRQQVENHIYNTIKIYNDESSLRKIPLTIASTTLKSLSQSKIIPIEEDIQKIQRANDKNLLASLYTKQAIAHFHIENEKAKVHATTALSLAQFQKGSFLSIENYFWNSFILNSVIYKKENKDIKALLASLKILTPWKHTDNPTITSYVLALAATKERKIETVEKSFKVAIKEALKTNNYLLTYFLYRELYYRISKTSPEEKKKYQTISQYYWKKWSSNI